MEENNIRFELSAQTIEDLKTYSSLLNKDMNSILNEALQEYFEREQEKIESSQILETDRGMTNLDYQEFWDDVDI